MKYRKFEKKGSHLPDYDAQLAELKEIIIECTNQQISFTDTLEVEVNFWMATLLQNIANSELKTCQLVA